MAASIEENIDFFRDLPKGEAYQAAIHAQAAEFIQEKEGGMGAGVAVRGNNLSGGQKQRIMIARALAGKPRILVLDDASSALDYRTDAKLRQELHTHYQDTTSVIVAQRVSSILNAGHILVLEEGECAGYGTHQELLESCREYRLIYEQQMGAKEGATA